LAAGKQIGSESEKSLLIGNKIDHIQIIEFTLRLAVLTRYEFPRTCGVAVAEFFG
tara:strand:- start:747 stop:911 length:165 start_codon:yes stop_codon:yes gene_type:complete